jgi:hypothetical protein
MDVGDLGCEGVDWVHLLSIGPSNTEITIEFHKS